MKSDWNKLVKSFPTTPFLFVGSGLTRRYLNLPGWEDLLRYFAGKISSDDFAYERYRDLAANDMPKIGSLIESDFNKKWFSDPEFRTDDENVLKAVKNGASPFKAEVAYYIGSFTEENTSYSEEIAALKALTKKNIAGFITTNYDKFLENMADGYKVYVGQEELIFSSLQEIAEIFKIHGSVDNPASLVISEADYKQFEEKSKYLAAKLMTIFMEYPIIFVGYSLSDKNIQTIISSIVGCLSDENLLKLQNRFVFIKHKGELKDEIKIGTFAPHFNGRTLEITQIETDNFQMIFEGLKEKQAGIPVRLLRFLKEQFYNYTLTNIPSKHVVANLMDENVSEEDIGFFIGRNTELARNGLLGLGADQWYKGILFDDALSFPADDLLAYAFSELMKQNGNGKLPVFKYLSEAHDSYPEVLEKTGVNSYDNLLNATILKYRETKTLPSRNVKGLITAFTNAGILDEHVFDTMAYLKEEEIDVEDLGIFLRDYYLSHPEGCQKNFKSSLRRLIRIYDWLKYGNK